MGRGEGWFTAESDEDRHIMLKKMLIDARKAVFDVEFEAEIERR